jgi:hypothetical protein
MSRAPRVLFHAAAKNTNIDDTKRGVSASTDASDCPF